MLSAVSNRPSLQSLKRPKFSYKCSAFASANNALRYHLSLPGADHRPPFSLHRHAAEQVYELVKVYGLRDVLVAARGERLGVEVC